MSVKADRQVSVRIGAMVVASRLSEKRLPTQDVNSLLDLRSRVLQKRRDTLIRGHLSRLPFGFLVSGPN